MKIAQAFNKILQKKFQISGAMINKSKSIAYGWNVKHTQILQITDFLDFPGFDKWENIKYLGLPLTLGSSSPSLWLEVLENLKAKIASWGG